MENRVVVRCADFLAALNLLAPKRLNKINRQLKVDISLDDGAVLFSRAGAQVSCPLLIGSWAGYSTIDLATLLSFRTLSNDGEDVKIAYRDSRLYINSFSTPAPWVNAADWIVRICAEARTNDDEYRPLILIRNCKYGEACKGVWEELKILDDPNSRICRQCYRPVKFCVTPFQIKKALSKNFTVAYEAS